MKPIKGAEKLRKGRFSSKGHVYHCTFTTNNRLPVFNEFKSARLLISILKKDEESDLTKTIAFVIMPDHIHWLFELKSGSLSTTIKRVKSLYSWLSKTKIWAEGFHDHAIRADEDLIETARYIVANPLRAKLVKRVGEYPHWDCIWL